MDQLQSFIFTKALQKSFVLNSADKICLVEAILKSVSCNHICRAKDYSVPHPRFGLAKYLVGGFLVTIAGVVQSV
jgi:hypothetical protein